MAFREIVTQRKFINYKECKDGDHLVTGKLVETRPNKFGNGHVDWVFDTGKSGEPHVVLNHSGSLAYMFNQGRLEEGDWARVHYAGQETLDKGVYKGKPVHNFKVEIDKDKKIMTEAEVTNVIKESVKEVAPLKSMVSSTGLDIEDLD
jgi:hypothetical protein